MRVKVCGITTYHDAIMAVDEGVDALGFNFYPRSPRYIDPRDAGSIIARMPPFVIAVGLFVNVERTEDLLETARTARVQALQLHGDETPDYCRALEGRPVIKALRIEGSPVMVDLPAYPVQAFLLDAKDDTLFGGTGKSFDWRLAEEIKNFRPVILAGGLRTENVAEAIRIVQPYGVDVCSGVESRPGKKDLEKLTAFMNEVRNATRNLPAGTVHGA